MLNPLKEDTLKPLAENSNGQIVSSIGGEGVINNYRFESGNWEYLVQMPMGSESEMGRVGYETMILLWDSYLIFTKLGTPLFLLKSPQSPVPYLYE